MKYVGVDGCPSGWLAATVTDTNIDVTVFSRFDALWETHGDAAVILVDIPMGLPGGGRSPRRADQLAREMLGSHRSSIFLPSVREVLDCVSYGEANEKNRMLTGKGISKQYWYLVPKIKDVDSFLQSTPEAVPTVKEAHPELCFVLASNGTIRFSKKTAEGVGERLDILRRYVNDINEVYEGVLRKYLRKEVARDDIVDALILALTAREGGKGLKSLPDQPERDEAGMPMAIWYHDFGA